MKKIFAFLLIFVIFPAAFAEITVETDQAVYNIGNKIKASASALQPETFEGLFKLTISCGNFTFQYFLTPMALEPSFRTAVNVPELAVKSSMLGSCVIKGELTTNEGLSVEQADSQSFEATDRLEFILIDPKVTSLPGKTIKITGIVNEAHGNNVLKAGLKIKLDGNEYSTEIVDGKFDYDVSLPDQIKSGFHAISLEAADSKGNMGNASIELDITPVPTYIANSLNKDTFMPGEKMEINSSLYDQAGELIDETIVLELNSIHSKIFQKDVKSSEKLEYDLSQYAEPGAYTLKSTYKEIVATTVITVSTVKEVQIKYENESVVVENIGNIPFKDELTFVLRGDRKTYDIVKEVIIEPGKSIVFDLSKEVPGGVYSVVVPFKEGITPIVHQLSEAFDTLVTESGVVQDETGLIAEDVLIHDNRAIYKKAITGFASFTGFLIGSEGLLSRHPLIGPFILGLIVLFLIFKYLRKPFSGLLKRKKQQKEETKEDFYKDPDDDYE